MTQDAMAAVMEMQKEECLNKCTTSELARELAKRVEVSAARTEKYYRTTLIVRTKERII